MWSILVSSQSISRSQLPVLPSNIKSSPAFSFPQIHDSDMICNSPLEKIINGPSHHTLHHLYFTVNYGQYFTGCDRLGGSYRAPKAEDDPLLAVTGKGEKAAKEQAKAQDLAESKKSV